MVALLPFALPLPASLTSLNSPATLSQGWLQKVCLIEAGSEVLGSVSVATQPLVMLLLLLLPVLAAAASIAEEPEPRRQQSWRNGEEAESLEEAKSERSLETWRGLRTNRQKLRELAWEKFNQKQAESEGLQEMQVSH